jgi:phosphoglycerate kinase
MMEQVLKNGTADAILTTGLTGIVFLTASGIKPGEGVMRFLGDRGLLGFVEQAKALLGDYSDKIEMPLDLAYESEGKRCEIAASQLPGGPGQGGKMYMDIGGETIERYAKLIAGAATIFINGPSGVFEDPLFEEGTRRLWQAAAESEAYSVVGGGDSVSAAQRFSKMSDFGYICTAGGAMVRFLSGKRLPLIEAMEERTED